MVQRSQLYMCTCSYMHIDNSSVNIFLVSASFEGASHTYPRIPTPLLPSPGWQKPIAYIWENGFNSLYSGLHIHYSSVIVATIRWIIFRGANFRENQRKLSKLIFLVLNFVTATHGCGAAHASTANG